MLTPPTPSTDDDDRKPSRSKIILSLGYVLASVVLAFLLTGIQSNESQLDQLADELDRATADLLARIEKVEAELEDDVTGLESALEAEIARLDESNRNRRDSIAELQVSTAANGAEIAELRRDVERVLVP